LCGQKPKICPPNASIPPIEAFILLNILLFILFLFIVKSLTYRHINKYTPPKVVKEMIEINHRQFIEIKKRLEELEKEIRKYDRELKEFEILRSIPGFGDVSTRTMKALIFDINRFESGKKLVSYLGLSPSSYDSGERVRHGRITKEGNKLGRKVLIEVAQKSSMKWHPLNRVYRRYVVKKGHNKAVVAIAAKLCRIMYRMLKNKEEFSVGKLLIKEPANKKNAYLINNVSVKTEGKAVKEG